ncbi:MAG: ribonucleoside-diphosphate reductase subunit alpha [Legionellales bacterium]|nr:ribonucleoside-diphosphate reductase subunit alpha [Legionellales bacterium]
MKKNNMWNKEWKKGIDYPEWGDTEVYKKTIAGGYLYNGENPKEAYERVCNTIAKRLGRPEMAETFFEYIWQGWLCLASPVLSNTGTDRGLPISCFGIDVADSIIDIGEKNLEMMLLAKHGGGVGIGINMIRPAGSEIKQNGTSDGVVPFCKIYDSTILATNQGAVRRGAASVNINIDHPDFEDWLDIREPKGDGYRQSLNLHQCCVVGDKFMRRLVAGDTEARKKWGKLLQKRKATGEPYILFKGNTNKQNPAAYKDHSLKVHMTNICSEIVLHTDENHSFVCCLSSLNIAKYDEWKNTNIIYDSIWFLDGVLEEFIQRAKFRKGFENSVRSAEKGRALGLGVLGWHTYLQEKNLPFEGLLSQYETRRIFSQIKIESERASMDLAKEFGEPLWCVGTGMRNTHLRAIAPTVSNSKLGGNVSPGIEPWAANVFTDQSAKGTFIRKNPTLQKLLQSKKLDTKEMWDKILADGGSVQDIKELSEEEKEIFKTFKEINQLELVRQAGIRQQYIDQSVSLNLAFPAQASPKWINKVHLDAWEKGIKTLYYMRTESVLRGDIAATAMDESCLSCDG